MDRERLWKTVLGELELELSKPTFAAFAANTHLVTFENGVATIGCNNAVTIGVLETRYHALFKKILDKHTQQDTSLIFKVIVSKGASIKNLGPLFTTNMFVQKNPESFFVPPTKQQYLRKDFTFETFAVSDSNQMAYAAATAVASSPGTSYNPLFLYGGVGVGKTHLMQAIGNTVVEKNPGAKMIYCMGEEFTNEIIDAIQTKTTKRFKDKYRSAKILLIDDVQFLEGKIKVQEEFFHTFNAVQRAGGQIVLTSDRPPHEIDRLEERLQSRFEGGLLVDVQNPDFTLRCAILRIKAQQKGTDLPMDVTQILAANSESVRKLEGLLTLLLTQALVKKLPINAELAYVVVGKPQPETPETKTHLVSPKQVIESVTKRFGVTFGQLKSEVRNRPIARPRQVLMFLLRTELKLPLTEVGIWVGGRDHSTVLHAVETISNLISTNSQLRDEVLGIKRELFG